MMMCQGGFLAWAWAYMQMVDIYGHGRQTGIGIWLHECMRLGSSRILIHVHGCDMVGKHMSKLVDLHMFIMLEKPFNLNLYSLHYDGFI
jgi:hypothetical protein